MSLQYDHEHLNDILEAAHLASSGFLQSLATRPAGRTPQPLPHDSLPEEGLGAQGALSAFRGKYEALLSASPGPRYLGFVTGGKLMPVTSAPSRWSQSANHDPLNPV